MPAARAPALSYMKKALPALLAALASLLLVDWPTARVAAEQTPASTMRADRSPREGDLARQIAAVIDSMDRSGRPPAGVAQGGRRAGRRGVFENAEGRLSPQPRGYYTETD